jgi:hypothetical protein
MLELSEAGWQLRTLCADSERVSDLACQDLKVFDETLKRIS